MKKAGAPHMGAPAFGLGGERLALDGVALGDRGFAVSRGALAPTSVARIAALAAGFASLVRVPLVGGALLVGGPASLAGDLALLFWGHRGKAPTLLVPTTICGHRHLTPPS